MTPRVNLVDNYSVMMTKLFFFFEKFASPHESNKQLPSPCRFIFNVQNINYELLFFSCLIKTKLHQHIKPKAGVTRDKGDREGIPHTHPIP